MRHIHYLINKNLSPKTHSNTASNIQYLRIDGFDYASVLQPQYFLGVVFLRANYSIVDLTNSNMGFLPAKNSQPSVTPTAAPGYVNPTEKYWWKCSGYGPGKCIVYSQCFHVWGNYDSTLKRTNSHIDVFADVASFNLELSRKKLSNNQNRKVSQVSQFNWNKTPWCYEPVKKVVIE